MQNYAEPLFYLAMIAFNAYFAQMNLEKGSRVGAACSLSAIACFLVLLGHSLYAPR